MNNIALQNVQRGKITRYSNNPKELLKWIVKKIPSQKVVMGTGFGPPGIVLLDILFQITREISVFYIDTDFLFDQTYELKNQLEERYDFKFIQVNTDISPNDQDKQYGKNLWEKDADACCNLRKVIPLKEVLSNYDVWITGIRRKQTQIRAGADLVEFEPRFEVIKINPLINWTHDEVWDYIKAHNLPYNPLHDRNYPSIGCKQCTSPVLSGADDRSGRWKGSKKTECGLHQCTSIPIHGNKGSVK